jgi:hypothetical protein
LFAQPFAQLGLIGKARDAGQLTDQRFVVEPLGIGQTGAPGAETLEPLSDDQFGTVTVRGAGAWAQAGQGAEFFPEAKLLGERFEGGEAAQRAMLAGRDALEPEFGRTFVKCRHGKQTPPRASRSNVTKKLHPQMQLHFTWLTSEVSMPSVCRAMMGCSGTSSHC